MTRRPGRNRRPQGHRAGRRAAGQVFSTVYAGHTGKLSYARIWRGTITDGATLGGTRLGGIYHYVDGELTKMPRSEQPAILSRSAGWTGSDRRDAVARRDAGTVAVPAAAAAGLRDGDHHRRPQG